MIPPSSATGLGLEVQRPDVARPEDAIGRRSKVATRRTPSRSAVATRTASASRGRCSARLDEELGGPREVGVGRRHEADGPTVDRGSQDGQGRPGPSSRWSRRSSSPRVSAPSRSGSSARPKPGDGGGVVEVGAVGRGEDGAAVEQDGHRSSAAAAGPVAGLASGDAPPVERQPAVGALADPDERRAPARVVLGEVRLEGGGDDRGLGRPLTGRANRPRRSSRSGSMRIVVRASSYAGIYATVATRASTRGTIAGHDPAVHQETPRGPLRAQPAHPRTRPPCRRACAWPAVAR